MATINYLYRTTKDEAPLNLRLLFRHNGKDFVIGGRTQMKVTREYWDNVHNSDKKIKDAERKAKLNEVNTHLTNLEKHILDIFDNTDIDRINKGWLRSTIEGYYNPLPTKAEKAIPKNLVDYIEHYLEVKKNDISIMSARRMRVVKNKMGRMESYLGEVILIKNINEAFKTQFQNYYNEERYSANTQNREFKMIKSFCLHAAYNGLQIHHQLDSLSVKAEEVKHIYLDFDEIKAIGNANLEHDFLENARDWLVVSCFTGQRISDFMRFDKDMIRIKDGMSLLEFRQRKTGKLMTIPVLKEVTEVLDKRGGEFPRAISDQKYNDYIKLVAEAAGINDMCTGKRRVNVKPEGQKASYRDVVGEYPKWQLVSSHIGRRSLATNFYGIIATSTLMGMTGHTTEEMFLKYIGKSNERTAMDAHNEFSKIDY